MRTKIVATIGPATCAPEKIAQLAENGVSVFRLNFSHGDPEFFRKVNKKRPNTSRFLYLPYRCKTSGHCDQKYNYSIIKIEIISATKHPSS